MTAYQPPQHDPLTVDDVRRFRRELEARGNRGPHRLVVTPLQAEELEADIRENFNAFVVAGRERETGARIVWGVLVETLQPIDLRAPARVEGRGFDAAWLDEATRVWGGRWRDPINEPREQNTLHALWPA